MPDYVGRQLGNYRLIRLLGEGGFAQVYLGEHIHLKTTAAIKVLVRNFSENHLQGFLTEARTIARLRKTWRYAPSVSRPPHRGPRCSMVA
jgi:serine/threonine protein kinase